VLADHGGLPGMSGGFLGVDVFFVLSGFLITSLLLDEFRNNGRIDLAGFWIRRARRLLPALLVMVLAVVALRRAFAPESVATLRDDAVASFFWAANWAFVGQHTDYFAQGAPPSPLQHTWSLAVEEQYYVIWPLLVIAVAALFWAQHRIAVFVLAAVGVAASAAVAIVDTTDASLNRVYFGTDTRAQALLVGAAAAALLVRDWSVLNDGGSLIRTRWGHLVAQALPVVGLAVLGAAAHYATGSVSDFRHGMLIVVALAAVLVIAPVALEQDGPVARALAWRPLVWLGTISYGVYLWHWPIFLALNGERTGWTGWPLFALRCAVTLAVAGASWWLLEQPIRRWRPAFVPMLPLAGATAATAAVITMTVLPVSVQPADGMPNSVQSAALVGPEVPVEIEQPSARTPGTRSVAVFGDSVAWTLMRYLPPTPGLAFTNYTTIGCGIARGGPYRTVGDTLPQKPECDTWPSRWSQRINHDRPDVVLLIIGRWEVVDRINEGRWAHVGQPAYDAYLRGELNRAFDILGSTGAKIVVTTEPYNRRAEKSDGSLYPEDEPDRIDAWNTLLRSVAKTRPNVSVLDLNHKLGPKGVYTNRIDGIQMRMDGVHPSPDAVKWLTPWLADALRR
jgi:peptidoglycan/LPS O-acetylase OafA/YrhL